MIMQINELYEEAIKSGSRVAEIHISHIGYDHLKSEMQNKREKPQWLDQLKIQENFMGVKLIAETGN